MIISQNNYIIKLKEIIEYKAKYQKILLVYSKDASDAEIDELYEAVRLDVIFDKVQLENFSLERVNNGYRLIILLCDCDDLLKIDYPFEDFINIYIPLKNEILPFYYLAYKKGELRFNDLNYILLKNNKPDAVFYSFFEFYCFIDVVESLRSNRRINLNEQTQEMVNLENAIMVFNKKPRIAIQSLEMIKKHNLEYKTLPFVELIILDAYEHLINNIKNSNLKLIDVYKYHLDDVEMVDKLYKTYQNKEFINLLWLNADILLELIESTKKKIQFLIRVNNITLQTDLNKLIDSVKDGAKDTDEFMELYLYDALN